MSTASWSSCINIFLKWTETSLVQFQTLRGQRLSEMARAHRKDNRDHTYTSVWPTKGRFWFFQLHLPAQPVHALKTGEGWGLRPTGQGRCLYGLPARAPGTALCPRMLGTSYSFGLPLLGLSTFEPGPAAPLYQVAQFLPPLQKTLQASLGFR